MSFAPAILHQHSFVSYSITGITEFVIEKFKFNDPNEVKIMFNDPIIGYSHNLEIKFTLSSNGFILTTKEFEGDLLIEVEMEFLNKESNVCLKFSCSKNSDFTQETPIHMDSKTLKDNGQLNANVIYFKTIIVYIYR